MKQIDLLLLLLRLSTLCMDIAEYDIIHIFLNQINTLQTSNNHKLFINRKID